MTGKIPQYTVFPQCISKDRGVAQLTFPCSLLGVAILVTGAPQRCGAMRETPRKLPGDAPQMLLFIHMRGKAP